MKMIKIATLLLALAGIGFSRERLSGFCEQGNVTVSTLTASSTTKVQGSYPSCTVTVYLAGTLTLASIYSDNSSTPLANPFTASNVGAWGFYANDGSYDVRFAGGGLPSPWVRSGAGLFDGAPTSQGTTNTVVRGIKNKLSDFLSVKDFGAVGDGATDDTAAINLALNQSIVGTGSTPGVCIYFPDGIYRTTAALAYTHTICAVGNQWRLKYTGSGTIAAVLSIIGDPVNTYGAHGSFVEGSVVDGAVIDGQGKATNGFILQGVVSAQINYMRVTNVTVAGVSCNWCQQTTFERLQISSDFENFSTTPQYGIIIDNISSANILHQVNIDHVSVDGIWLKYGLNTLVSGGTTEGNSGWGIRCDGSASPFRQCFNNTFIQLDTEANTSGDYLFGAGSFFNGVFTANSSSTVGVVFSGDAHFNTVVAGSIGGNSTGAAGTYGNSLVSVGSFSLTDPVWTDSGQNRNDTIRNQFTGTITPPTNNYNSEQILKFTASAARLISFYTPSSAFADIGVGAPTGPTWIGLNSQAGLAGWLRFANASPGMCFISEATYRGVATPQGCIVGGNWGFGAFNSAPAYKFHFLDASVTTGVFQNAPGQGAADLLVFRDKVSAGSTLFSSVDFLGAFRGPVTARHTGGVVTTFGSLPTCTGAIEGRMEPISDSTVNTWGTAIAGGGANHVLAYCDGTGVWSVMAK